MKIHKKMIQWTFFRRQNVHQNLNKDDRGKIRQRALDILVTSVLKYLGINIIWAVICRSTLDSTSIIVNPARRVLLRNIAMRITWRFTVEWGFIATIVGKTLLPPISWSNIKNEITPNKHFRLGSLDTPCGTNSLLALLWQKTIAPSNVNKKCFS